MREIRQVENASAQAVGLTWFSAFLVALCLYTATAHRGAQWQDSGAQQVRIVTGSIEHRLGLALVHPVHYYLGRIAIRLPFDEPAFAITLVSCIAGAAAVANVVALLLVMTGRLRAAIVAGMSLALSHTFWQQSTHTESYALVVALLSTECLCLAVYVRTRRTGALLALALLNGIGVANHLLALLATPIDAAVIVWSTRGGRISTRKAVAAAILWLIGTLPYSLLVIFAGVHSGDWSASLRSALFGDYADAVLNTHLAWSRIAFAGAYILYNFPGLTLPLAVYALWRRAEWPALFRRTMIALLVVYLVFAIRYDIVDQYTFYAPSYVLIAVLAGLGLDRALRTCGPSSKRVVWILSIVTALWTPLVYATVTRTLAARGALANFVGRKPYRDGYRVFFEPWGVTETHAEQVNRHAARLAGANGIILIADAMARHGVEYAQAAGQIPEHVSIKFIPASASADVVNLWRTFLAEARGDGRPVVLVPADRDHPRTCVEQARWWRSGDLYVFDGLPDADP